MICTNCGFTSSDDFSRCPQCGGEAVYSRRCSNCGEPIDANIDLYCEICGAINPERASEEGIVCDTHVENRAIGFCIVCGRAVCEECAESLGNKILCNDPRNREYLDKWKVVRTFDFEYEAAMLYANLEQQGIETHVFTKLNPDTSNATVSPTIVEVWVHHQKFEEAQEILKSLGLWEEDEGEED